MCKLRLAAQGLLGMLACRAGETLGEASVSEVARAHQCKQAARRATSTHMARMFHVARIKVPILLPNTLPCVECHARALPRSLCYLSLVGKVPAVLACDHHKVHSNLCLQGRHGSVHALPSIIKLFKHLAQGHAAICVHGMRRPVCDIVS